MGNHFFFFALTREFLNGYGKKRGREVQKKSKGSKVKLIECVLYRGH